MKLGSLLKRSRKGETANKFASHRTNPGLKTLGLRSLGISCQISKDVVRVLGVDIDLDNHAAILSVLEIEDNQVRECARRFIKAPNGLNLIDEGFRKDSCQNEQNSDYPQRLLF